MSDYELQLLTAGFVLGGYTVLLVQMVLEILDSRRTSKRLKAAEADLAAKQADQVERDARSDAVIAEADETLRMMKELRP